MTVKMLAAANFAGEVAVGSAVGLVFVLIYNLAH